LRSRNRFASSQPLLYSVQVRKPVKTQWDFGDLFAQQDAQTAPSPAAESPAGPSPVPPPVLPQSLRKILSVSQLTGQIRRLLEGQVGLVWVTGEITNLRVQTSGHIYFTLKDASAQLSCVLFRGELMVDRSLLQDGKKVTVRGDVTVYEQRGQYQLRVLEVEAQGDGALQLAFEKLKQKLSVEGLFAKERKRPLPKYPRRIGLVTSPTGAAIRDVLHVIERRNPSLQIILAPCRVQGDGAGMEIAAAIRLLNQFNHQAGGYLDLILITRGGGSLEDLWAFNEEAVARAIYHSALPVVSAVGHEIDFTISDFVADLRAATPSAAAELITEGVFSSCQWVAEAAGRIRQLARQQLQDKQYVLGQAFQRLARVHPRRKVNDWLQQLDDLNDSLRRTAKQTVRQKQDRLQNIGDRLARVRPALLLSQRRQRLERAELRLRERTRHHLRNRKHQASTLDAKLRLLSPEQVLARGYSITLEDDTGKVLRAPTETAAGKVLRTRLKGGFLKSRVEPNSES
jgi:exodeoxyribonuclease VII large subunit